MARVLVLDGHSPAALAFVRSLGRAGNWVAVGFTGGAFAPAALSRYCQIRLEYPNPAIGMIDFVNRIQLLVKQHRIDLVVPMTDATIWPLTINRQQFQGPYSLGIPSREAIELVSDKHRTLTSAKELGIPVPKTELVSSVEYLEALSVCKFPLVLKDRFSIRWLGNKGVSGGVHYAYSYNDLRRKVKNRLKKVGEILVQEFICGTGIGFSCFAAGGEIYLPFQWQRIREKDPRGSGSSARMSVRLDPEVLEFSQKLIMQSGYEGISMVEFKKDEQTGHHTLMEINGRPWGSMQLPIHCGIDYPRYLIEWYLEGQTPPKEIDYRRRSTCRWLSADLLHLENLWEGKPNGWPTAYPNFFKSLIKISIPWYPGLRYDHLSLHDPKPGIADIAMWIRSHLGDTLI